MAAGGCASSVWAQATFTPMGPIPSAYQVLYVKSVTDDGEVMVILDAPGAMYNAATWNKSGGFTILPTLEPGARTRCEHVSPDGRLLAGSADQKGVSVAVVWIDGDGPFPVGSVPPTFQGADALGVSWDGSVVGGQVRQPNGKMQGCLASEMHGFELIPLGPNDLSNSVAQLPEHGDVVLSAVSHGGLGGSQEGIRWTRAGGVEYLGDLPGGAFFSNLGLCSRDGRVGAGRASPPTGTIHMARWTEASGWQDLGGAGWSAGISGDGWAVVGVSGSSATGNLAAMWEPVQGLRFVQDILEQEYGLNLPGWTLREAHAISDNGRYIAGTGHNPQGKLEGWLVEMPPFCYADCDRSTGKGVLDVFDFLCFMNRFNAQDPYGNCDNDGAFDVYDFLCFINHFNQGCGQ